MAAKQKSKLPSSFGRHESFHLRQGWLRKGLLALRKDPKLFMGEFPSDHLGVGHNMVHAIRFWLVATQLIKEKSLDDPRAKSSHYQLTDLATLILKEDPYFEDDSTWWVLHYHLVTNRSYATTWYWFFHEFGMQQFSGDIFLTHLCRYVEGVLRRKISRKTLERDMHCFIRTYVQSDEKIKSSALEDNFACPFVNLNLLEILPLTRTYRLARPSEKQLPALVIAYALMSMTASQALNIENNGGGQTKPIARGGKREVSFREAQVGSESPGRAFVLDAESLYTYITQLEKFETKHRFVQFGHGKNTLVVTPHLPLEILSYYYQTARTAELQYA